VWSGEVHELLEVLTASIVMETVSTSETSVNVYHTTRLNKPKDSHLHIRLRENLKSSFFYSSSPFHWRFNFIYDASNVRLTLELFSGAVPSAEVM
jgi:hypothetical protein